MADPWVGLAKDYENARNQEDSFDRLLDWPAQQAVLGDVRGLRILDVGCGSGAKALALAGSGAAHVTGVDISGVFVEHQCPQVELVQGDLSDLAAVSGLAEDRFDRIVFFQSISYSRDQRQTLVDARSLLAEGGKIIVQRSHPIRFAVERAEANGTSLGQEYYSTEAYAYRSGWNPAVTLSHSTETVSDMLNTFAAVGLSVDAADEPQLSAEDRVRYPHKQAWLNKYLGVILFTLSASSSPRFVNPLVEGRRWPRAVARRHSRRRSG